MIIIYLEKFLYITFLGLKYQIHHKKIIIGFEYILKTQSNI